MTAHFTLPEGGVLEISIFLGFFVGYVVGNIFSRLLRFRDERQAAIMAQIQALRLFSQSVLHYGHLRQWHDNVAIGMDNIKVKALETVAASETISEQEKSELMEFWGGQYEQELKSVWNNFEWDMKKFKDTSVSLISQSTPTIKPPYQNWQQAMHWLAAFELNVAQKIKEQNNSEEEIR